jgi:hypothetical protein
MSFRISSALWDRIHHYASFPQTGGTRRGHCRDVRHSSKSRLYYSVLAADGPVWPKP